ncbi:secretory carrier-associated membrane protein 3 [Trichinella spiralis]|uniref:secretory carrier-associated membrane protein 3 n=1 Tax=Trichinella spiralis TaxID=6334 RepID=UPI0001EFF059|nr:secretory carrier-associated membrane protein 3 [Trichinella spiralis]
MSNFLQIITIPVLLGALSSSMIDAVCQERQVVKEIAYGFQWHKMLSISTTLAIPELDKASMRNKNWPPLPSWFPLQPCFYHDISVDIPQQYQRIVRMGYNLWLIYVLTLVLNVVGSLASFITHGSGLQFGLSIIQVAMFTPCSFVLWYRPLYKAFKNDSSFNFMVYFFVMFLQLVFVAIQSLGIESFGTCGWFNSLGHFGLNAGAAVLMLIVTLGFTFCGVGLLLLLFRVHRLYRSTGASFAKAQQEFSQGVINNPHVQQAAATAAGAAVRNQFAESGGTQRY